MRLAILAAALLAACPAVAALPTGAKAPAFTTQGAQAGKVVTVDLQRLLAKGPVVLYFFPAAFTSGCNAEARAFADKLPAFSKAGATVVGLSTDTVPVLQKFSQAECAGRFAVATATPTIVQGYDVALGRAIPGKGAVTNRTSYVIGRDGRIALVYSDMSPVNHITRTLASVEAMAKGAAAKGSAK